VRFEGSLRIAAPREAVFAFLDDPTQVGHCGPGVESVEVLDGERFRARARVGIGPIAATFALHGEVVERAPPNRSVMKVRGHAPGSALDAVTEMRLRADDDGTIMDWQAEVTIGGTLASVGARLIGSTADKLIAQTFECIRARLEGSMASEDAGATAR
jgi:carbon monoxide dehydrogenase subunit G